MKQTFLLWVMLLAPVVGLTPANGQSNFLIQLATGSGGVETHRSATLSNYTVSSTLTARGALGAALVEKAARWSVVSFPASGSQASASIAAESGVRHVVDCVTWGADAGGAVTAAAGDLAIRDGATGAGTVIWRVAVAHAVAAAAGVQTIPPNTVCGLNLVGTTNTAMTAEFNAGVTGEVQSVSLSGFNVQ